MHTSEYKVLNSRLILNNKLIRAAIALAPWVSASLSELQPGHTGEYEKIANEFLDLVQQVT